MTKRSKESAGCIVRRTPKGLVPVSGFDMEQLINHPLGSEFKLVRLTKRSLPQHRTYWKALSIVAANDERWATAEHLHQSLKMACGLVTETFNITTGEVVLVPDSTSFEAMDQEEFQIFFDRAMASLSAAIGWDPLYFLAEAA